MKTFQRSIAASAFCSHVLLATICAPLYAKPFDGDLIVPTVDEVRTSQDPDAVYEALLKAFQMVEESDVTPEQYASIAQVVPMVVEFVIANDINGERCIKLGQAMNGMVRWVSSNEQMAQQVHHTELGREAQHGPRKGDARIIEQQAYQILLHGVRSLETLNQYTSFLKTTLDFDSGIHFEDSYLVDNNARPLCEKFDATFLDVASAFLDPVIARPRSPMAKDAYEREQISLKLEAFLDTIAPRIVLLKNHQNFGFPEDQSVEFQSKIAAIDAVNPAMLSRFTILLDDLLKPASRYGWRAFCGLLKKVMPSIRRLPGAQPKRLN